MLQTQPVVRAKGVSIPSLGLGTWQVEGKECAEIVEEGLRRGYRHLDTAQAYDNEEFVGEGIKQSRIDRDQIFLTTKVWFDHFTPSKLKSSVETSLRKLKTDHVNLLLLHWPVFKDSSMEETLDALMEVREEGKTLSIGVSNFPVETFRKAVEHTSGAIVANQVEYHPFLDQSTLKAELEKQDVALVAYSPLAQGDVFEDEVLKEIAQEHSTDPAQVALAWLVSQNQVAAIPRTSSAEHLRSNFRSLELDLSAEELERINSLRDKNKRIVDPSFAPDWDA